MQEKMRFCANTFFQELLIIFHCLWCRGTNPPYAAVYLIDNMYDPVCGCDVASHDASAFEGEALKEGKEKGFAFASWWQRFPGGSCCGFPHLPKRLPGAPPRLCSCQCAPALRELCAGEVTLGLGAAPHAQTGKAVGLLALGWLLRVGALTPTPWQDELLCRFMRSRICAALKDPIRDFSLGEGRQRGNFSLP